VSSWYALFAPAKTPPEIIRKMHADTVAALKDPPTKERLEQLGVLVVGSTPEQLAAFLKAEMDKWAPVIKEAGISIRE
jgi:tripartite-type tricarboxylate transporter receptor subunit TctC